MVADPWLLGIEWTVVERSIHQRQAGPGYTVGFTGWALGTVRGARNWSSVLGREEPNIQQTSAEAFLLSPILLGLAARIIIFSQVPRVFFSYHKSTNSSCGQGPSLQRQSLFALHTMRKGPEDTGTTRPNIITINIALSCLILQTKLENRDY